MRWSIGIPGLLPEAIMIQNAVAQPSDSTWAQDLALLISLLGGPFAWLLNFHVGYVLSEHICATHSRLWVYMTCGLCLAISIVALALPWRAMRENGESRTQFMAWLGVMSSAFFAVVIIAQSIASVMVDPCPD